VTLEQSIRLQRRAAERQLRTMQKLGRWPRRIRKASLEAVRAAFGQKREQIRAMVDASEPVHQIREYAQSSWVVLS